MIRTTNRTRRSTRTTTRRALLAATGAATATALAGCLGGDSGGDTDDEPPAPIALSGGKSDDFGGMVIGEHFGPNGQIFYANNSPDGHDNPAWFHTLAATLFPYYFEHKRQDWTAEAVYVTDYSAVDYELTTQGDKTYISTHTAADTFGDAEAMTYVASSRVMGGMGADLIPFGDDADASAFVSEHGGRTIEFGDINREFVQSYR
jgi:nitrous oxide reductase accessory protein NosL